MEKEFIFPDLGEGITEGELVKWLIRENDQIQEDQEIAEVETDKALVSIPSAFAGKVKKLCYQEGDLIQVGTPLLTYETNEKSEKQTEENKLSDEETLKEISYESKTSSEKSSKRQSSNSSFQEASNKLPPLASPATRKLARELDVDLQQIQGSGKGGRITDDDILEASQTKNREEKSSTSSKAKEEDHAKTESGKIESISLKGIRRKIAETMQRSHQEMVMVTHMDEARVDQLLEIRKEKAEFAKERGIKLTLLAFVLKACGIALQDHPSLNASLENDQILFKKYYHFGFAVDTESGLIVPVIRNVNSKSILKIAKELTELSTKARERSLTIEELQDHTFSITNIGSVGGIFFTPIIHHPDSAILGVGQTQLKPIVDKENKIVAANMLPLALTFDHRISDGATAARFVKQVISYLEDPDLLLLEEGEN